MWICTIYGTFNQNVCIVTYALSWAKRAKFKKLARIYFCPRAVPLSTCRKEITQGGVLEKQVSANRAAHIGMCPPPFPPRGLLLAHVGAVVRLCRRVCTTWHGWAYMASHGLLCRRVGPFTSHYGLVAHAHACRPSRLPKRAILRRYKVPFPACGFPPIPHVKRPQGAFSLPQGRMVIVPL